MKIEEIEIELLKPYEKNPRVIGDDAIEKVANSIKEFGFQQPIVVDKDLVIIVGHTRTLAAKKLGLKKVPVLIADNLTEEQVRAYRLADNKTADYTFWDNKLLLEELDEIGFDIFTGFEMSDVFNDVLDENDNSVLDENEEGVKYIIRLQTADKEKAYKAIEDWGID